MSEDNKDFEFPLWMRVLNKLGPMKVFAVILLTTAVISLLTSVLVEGSLAYVFVKFVVTH